MLTTAEFKDNIEDAMEMLETRYRELKEKEKAIYTELHDIRVAMGDIKALKIAVKSLEEFDKKYSKENEG